MDIDRELTSRGIGYVAGESRYMVNCPFHNDSNPSCGIWKDSGYFKCFACGEEGSFAEFVAEVDGISVGEASRGLRGEDRVSTVEDKIRRFLETSSGETKYYSVIAFSRVFPAVTEGSPEWKYLTGPTRKLTPESIRRFHIRKGTGRFHDRVVLPIFTTEGKLLAYVGRASKKGLSPKTMKSRSPHKTLFGLYELIHDAGPECLSDFIVVVEGEFDAIYLQQYGIPAVSNMGTSEITPQKIQLLRRYTRKVVMSYDDDEAGLSAMYGKDEKKTGQVASLRRHLPVVSVTLPEGKDPNDLSPDEVCDIYAAYRVADTFKKGAR